MNENEQHVYGLRKKANAIAARRRRERDELEARALPRKPILKLTPIITFPDPMERPIAA